MKITDLKCAVIGQNPVIRITTDEGIVGWGEAEAPKHYLKPHILFYKQFIVGEDPTNVERFRDGDERFPAQILGQDGIGWLRDTDGTIDLLYLDADGPRDSGKSIYLDLLTAALPALRPGSLVLAHNSVNSAHTMMDYLATVRDPARFRQSVNMIVDDQGLEVSLY